MTVTIHSGDCLEVLRRLPAGAVQTCVTSPPYFGLRSYLSADDPNKLFEVGTEDSPEEYVATLVSVFCEVKRVLRDDGTAWINLGDNYLPGKQLAGMPWRVAFALQADGWVLRQECIWHKTNGMPESVTDRPTRAHETIFLLSKSARYFYDVEASRTPAKEDWGTRDRTHAKYNNPGTGLSPHGGLDKSYPTANRRTVWPVATAGTALGHFAAYPPQLIEPCVLAGSRPGDTILDPFFGVGTSGLVASRLGRHAIGIELNGSYVEIAEKRLREDGGMFADVVLAA